MKISTDILKKILVVMILLTIAVASATKLTQYTTSEDTHAHEIEQIDNKISTVMGLTAGASAASAAISLLPGDGCTPIATELAELAKYFLLVLSALFLEKYMLTLTGYASFLVLIPVTCLVWGWGYFKSNKLVKNVAYKLLITALVVYITVPAGVWASDVVYKNYEASMQATIDEVDQISVVEEDNSDGVIDKITSWISNTSSNAVDYVTDMLSRFVESLAIMIVTSCLIPLLVLVLMVWLVKTMFSANINWPMVSIAPVDSKGRIESKGEND